MYITRGGTDKISKKIVTKFNKIFMAGQWYSNVEIPKVSRQKNDQKCVYGAKIVKNCYFWPFFGISWQKCPIKI